MHHFRSRFQLSQSRTCDILYPVITKGCQRSRCRPLDRQAVICFLLSLAIIPYRCNNNNIRMHYDRSTLFELSKCSDFLPKLLLTLFCIELIKILKPFSMLNMTLVILHFHTRINFRMPQARFISFSKPNCLNNILF